jgi:ribosomal protein L31E
MSNAAKRHQMQSQVSTVNPATDPSDDDTENSNVVTRNFQIVDLVLPATLIRFSKSNKNPFYEIVTFEQQGQLVSYLAATMGAVRVFDGSPESLKDVPTVTLLAAYNSSRGDSPLDRFRDRHTAEARTAEVLQGLAVKYEDTSMAKAEAAAVGQNSTDAKAAEKKAAREAKAAQKATEKEAAKKATAEKRAGGVIGTIKTFLESKTGGTQAEILDALVTKFPERTRDGMSSTVKIQVSRLAKSTGREIASKEIVGRGRVYRFVDAGPIPGKEVVKEAPAPEAAKPKGGKKNAAKAPETAGAAS